MAESSRVSVKEFVKNDKNVDPPFSLRDLYPPPVVDPGNPGGDDLFHNFSIRKEMEL